MRNWWIAFVAGAVVVGCAGGNGGITTTSGSGSTAGGTTGTTGVTREVPSVNLPSTLTDIRVLFLSGQARRGIGSTYAKLDYVNLRIPPVTQIPSDLPTGLDGFDVKLDGFTVNTFQWSEGSSPDIFTDFAATVKNLRTEDNVGAITLDWEGTFALPTQPVIVPLVPGRQVSLPIYLSDASLFFNTTTNLPEFNQAIFDTENSIDVAGPIPASLSDLVTINLSALATADRPTMANASSANELVVSGDAYGIANGRGTDGSLDIISSFFIDSGTINNGIPLPDPNNPGSFINSPGSWTVLEDDPSAPPASGARVTALQGSWFPLTSRVTAAGDFTMVIFPTTNPSGQHMVVAMNGPLSAPTAVWFGRATYSGNSGTVELWSVDQLDNRTENNKAVGTLNNFTMVGGVPKDGDFTISTVPTGFPFPSSGSFAVYR
ncbi:MAG: hypothetical protein KDC26_05200 [Armatimonadetes bacterium]|nr:hypothetical protein [Armatimonadota bacterium]